MRPAAFTLVELLVVITIIIVLLALLTPALDRAIYSAELATCGANLKAIGLGVTSYATSHRNVYPRHNSTRVTQPAQVCRTTSAGTVTDDRPMLREALGSMKPFVCPLSGKLDLDSTSDGTTFYSGYNLFMGTNYLGQAGLRRLGQHWTSLTNVDSSGLTRVRRFETIAGDRDLIYGSNAAGVVQSSHPDRDGVLFNVVVQDSTTGNGYAPIGSWTIAWWLNTQSMSRGFTDDNFVQTDGSVLQIRDIDSDNRKDERISKVPIFFEDTKFQEPFEGIFVPRGK